jgi:hypothetical protein
MLKKLALPFLLFLVLFLLFSHQKVFAQIYNGGGSVCSGIGTQSSCPVGFTCKSNNVPGNATGTCQQDATTVPTTKSGIDAASSVGVSTNNSEAFPKINFPCTEDTKDNNPEFHSLRPYQAAPCGEANKALYCSNDLIFVESFDMAFKSSSCQFGLPSPGERTFTCNPDYKVYPHNLYVSLDNSNFPIMGNTEQVKNSQNSGDTYNYNDATKVNEYVSWYLSGVNTRAEYGEPTNSQIVNFSGPVQKLLPSAIAEAQRVKVITDVNKMVSTTSEVNGSTNTDAQNHNQIAVCASGAVRLLPRWITDFLGTPTFGADKAVECYPKAKSKAQGTVYRLMDWRGKSNIQSIINSVGGYLTKLFPGNLIAQIMGSAGIRWEERRPPLPWADQNNKPFATNQDYQKAYNEWRGQLCAFLPNIFGGGKTLVCLGAWPIISNPYADLFPFVPLAETPDKEGAEKIDNVILTPDGGTKIAGQKFGPILTPPLYFAHTEEVKQLSETLNKTYIPKGVTSVPLPKTTEKNVCSVVNVRANPGDNLFPGDTSELQVQAVEYVIVEATCHEVWTRSACGENEFGRTEYCDHHTLECPANITITIKTSTLTPNADKIFSTTVADSTSTFRKIYPKVEPGAPVSCIADIPTVTNVTYDPRKGLTPGSQSPNGGSLSFSVKNFPEDGGNVTPQLTFPHIGSIYDYFLKGIQTALRPKGYGDPTPMSADSCIDTPPVACGDWESKLVESGGACGVCNTNLGPLAQKILASAGAAFGVPAANIYAAMKHEGIDWAAFQGNLTDENVRKWSNSTECKGEPMPSCNNNSESTQPPFGFLKAWFYKGSGTSAVWTAVQKIDPSRNTTQKVSRCNFLDAAYAAAKTLKQGSSMTVSGTSCGSYSFDSTQPGSCSAWTDAKVAQSQVAYSGQCANNPKYETVPFKIEDVVAWEHAAKCQ